MPIERGIANNNPGNIILTDKPWAGEVPRAENTDGTFKQFDTMQDGIRAIFRNLKYYFKSGYNTIEQIIGHWDPSQGAYGTYVTFVADSTGYERDKKIRPTKENMVKLARAIIDFENGPNNIGTKQITAAYDSQAPVKPEGEERRRKTKKTLQIAGLISGTALLIGGFILLDNE